MCSVSSLFWLLSVLAKDPLYVWPHLFRGAGHEKRRGEQLLHLVCTLEVFHVHSYQDQFIQPSWAECVLCVFSLGLYFVYSFVFL